MGTALDENLPADRLGRLDAFAKTGGVDRRVAPAEKDLPLVGDHLFDNVFDDLTSVRIARQKQRADGVFARLGQDKAEFACFPGEKGMWNLHQHAAAIAGLGVRANRAAMIEIEQDLKAHLNDVMRLAVMEVGHETDPASVMFIRAANRVPARRANSNPAKFDRAILVCARLVRARQSREGSGRERLGSSSLTLYKKSGCRGERIDPPQSRECGLAKRSSKLILPGLCRARPLGFSIRLRIHLLV